MTPDAVRDKLLTCVEGSLIVVATNLLEQGHPAAIVMGPDEGDGAYVVSVRLIDRSRALSVRSKTLQPEPPRPVVT